MIANAASFIPVMRLPFAIFRHGDFHLSHCRNQDVATPKAAGRAPDENLIMRSGSPFTTANYATAGCELVDPEAQRGHQEADLSQNDEYNSMINIELYL